MVTVTNNTKDFIENQTEELFMYGAGNSGYWIGHYLNRCGIEFSGYIDSYEKYRGALCQGKPIYQPQKLSEYRGKSIRLIISPRLYETVLSDLLFSERKYGFHALCLVPRYMHFNLHKEVYDINAFLGYFRKRLYGKDTPTIISNDCVGGEIYRLMDMPMLSPTVNTYIAAEDFQKICEEPEKYFSIEGKDFFYNILPIGDEPGDCKMRLPAMKIEDITVTFVHTNGRTTELVNRWNMMRKRINWENIIYAFRTTRRASSKDFVQFFSKLPQKHLLMNYGINGVTYKDMDQLFFVEDIFGIDRAIENDFDLLGWLNQEESEEAGS